MYQMADQQQAKTVQFRREETINSIAREYRDSVRYTAELKRALDVFDYQFPPESPFRYIRKGIGEAIVEYLQRTSRPKSVKELMVELEAGNCILSALKPASELVSKAVGAYQKKGILTWLDAAHTQVGLAAWKKRAKAKTSGRSRAL